MNAHDQELWDRLQEIVETELLEPLHTEIAALRAKVAKADALYTAIRRAPEMVKVWGVGSALDAYAEPVAEPNLTGIPAPPEPEHLRHDSSEMHCWMDGWDIGYRAARAVADARLDDCVEQVDRVSDDIVTWATRVMAVEQTTDALRRDVDVQGEQQDQGFAGLLRWQIEILKRIISLESRERPERPEPLTIEMMGAMLAAACQAEPLVHESRVEAIVKAALAARGGGQ